MLLSLLDRSRTRAGHPDGAALHDTVERARWAERAAYHRFWVAEHHGVPGVASGSPPVLLAAVGAATSTIRIGSGGIMLPHHQPLVVAEQARMLEALHPGRIDLGLGRSPGFTEPVRRALRQPSDAPDGFAADLAELDSYLRGTAPVTARPAGGGRVPLHVLATGRGLEVAARLGLPVVLGGPVLAADDLEERVAAYRRDFRPADADTDAATTGDAAADRPRVTVSLDVLVADDARTARRLALPEAWAMARSRQTGEFGPLEHPDAIDLAAAPVQVRERVEAALDRTLAGTPAQVGPALERLVERAGAAEVLASTSTFDRDALHALDDALARLVA